ncbi:MAG: isopenicillin N synthase family oxygenase, partial [Xanthomonadales bacterium]|nr:isopenicillin N synthase family oxygenase [Xanthomonadales bacterium]
AEEMPDNLWPTEVEGFRQYGYGLYEALDGLGRVMLQAIALHLGLRQDWFDDKVNHGNSILRPIHYPPIGDPETASVRAGQHEDINLITLLIGSSAEGLQLLRRDGSWLPVTTQGDAIVCNIGDMLQRLTNHVLPSTTHRVVNPVGEKARQPRYSIPFFLHPNPDFVIETLPGCISADNPNRYPESITAQGYLQERLREIRLI